MNTVLCSENQDQMDGIIEFVGSLPHIGTHTISLVRGDLANGRYKDVDPDKYLHAINRLKTSVVNKARTYRFAGAGVKAAQDRLQRHLIHRTLKEQKRIIPCYAGKLNLVLSETGDVYPCEIRSDTFGNVRDFGYDMRKVLRSGKAKEICRSIAKDQCFCTHECYFMTNILFNPKLYPRLARECMSI